MNAEGAIPVHIDSKRWKAPRLPSSCLPSRGRRNVGGLKSTRFERIGKTGWCGGKRDGGQEATPRSHGIRTGTPAPHSKPR
jgi:hypothetical protein